MGREDFGRSQMLAVHFGDGREGWRAGSASSLGQLGQDFFITGSVRDAAIPPRGVTARISVAMAPLLAGERRLLHPVIADALPQGVRVVLPENL